MEAMFERVRDLQLRLHQIPEVSGCEAETKRTLTEYLASESDLEIVDCGRWFYAAHREGPGLEGLALRADMDAVTGTNGRPYHGCGHDGHMAVMAALAVSVTGKRLGKNLFFLFQHAEETGEGGAECCALFEKEHIDRIYGFHNCPGFPAGAVLLRRGTFACGSRGLILRFEGRQSHAAYPENGRNPIFPMTAFFSCWQSLTDPAQYGGPVLATPVGITAGSRAFGVAAGSGEIDLTLRAWQDADLEKLAGKAVAFAEEAAAQAGILLTHTQQDVFPATVNDPALRESVETAAAAAGLQCLYPEEPFRWSEDFGHYGARCPAFFCGIGAGEDTPGLHTPDYRWNDAVSDAALRLFSALIRI